MVPNEEVDFLKNLLGIGANRYQGSNIPRQVLLMPS